MAVVTATIGTLEGTTTWEYDYDDVALRLLRFRCLNTHPTLASEGTIVSTAPGWQPATAYAFDLLVQPAPPGDPGYTGHVYRATVGGVSGAVRPTFPTGNGATVVDGTVTWKEIGPDRISRTCPATTTQVYDLPATLANLFNIGVDTRGRITGILKSIRMIGM